jgi:serine/threonine protein kinase
MTKIKGGKAIASGGFGCVFKPAIKCKTRKNNEAGITKLMKTKYAKAEYKEIQEFKELLDDIPNYGDYFLLDGFSLCDPEELTKEDLEKFDKKCKSLKKIDITASNVNKSLDKLLSLNMPYGGFDIGDYVEREKMDYKKIHKMNNALIELLKKGIVSMNQRNVYHCDIKDSNILVKDDGHSEVNTRLIDWGLSTTYKSGANIPKPLTNRPFQFNVPFSVVLFNDTFTKMYAEFLKKHKDPNFFIIRSFVINYVISWVNKRGPGHLRALNSIFKEFFERGLINIEEQFKEDLIEFDYTFYFIFEYISYVLFKFTRDGKFEKMEYFSQVFLKNLDVWGFTMTYLPILEYLSGYYNKLCDCELEIIDKIKEMVLYVIECSYVPIDVDKIVAKLEYLNALFLKADKKSTAHFQEKRETSSLTQSKTKSKTKSKTSKSSSKSTTKKSSQKSKSSSRNKTSKHSV